MYHRCVFLNIPFILSYTSRRKRWYSNIIVCSEYGKRWITLYRRHAITKSCHVLFYSVKFPWLFVICAIIKSYYCTAVVSFEPYFIVIRIIRFWNNSQWQIVFNDQSHKQTEREWEKPLFVLLLLLMAHDLSLVLLLFCYYTLSALQYKNLCCLFLMYLLSNWNMSNGRGVRVGEVGEGV